MSPGIQPTGEASPQATRVREAAPSDAEAVAAIYNHYITTTLVTFEEEPVAVAEIGRRMEDVRSESLPWPGRRGGRPRRRIRLRHTVEAPRRLSLLGGDHGRPRVRSPMGAGSARSSSASSSRCRRPAASAVRDRWHRPPNEASVGASRRVLGLRKVAHFEAVWVMFSTSGSTSDPGSVSLLGTGADPHGSLATWRIPSDLLRSRFAVLA